MHDPTEILQLFHSTPSLPRFTLNIPVILQGPSGVGKSRLITYLDTLYGTSRLVNIRDGGDIISQINEEVNEDDDIIIVHFDSITNQASLDYILKIITSRRINGAGIPDNIKFVLELREEKQDLHDLFCIVMNINYDYEIVKGKVRSGIEWEDVEEVVEMIEGLDQENDPQSYRFGTKILCIFLPLMVYLHSQ